MSQMCPNCSFDNPDDAKKCKQCPAPLRGLLGENILLSQRYRVSTVLGCGSMGAVYLAEDTRLSERRCAIKENRIDPQSPVDVQEQTREQFLAEANILAKLDHPNLPKVSDYFIENDREYLVMDYVEGEDLESRMVRTQKPLEEENVVNWADQVLDALAYLHNQKPKPIIHRDIKPANLRIDLYNRIKLVDFGLVKLYDANSPETKAELRGVGTPAYAPLEQFAGSDEHTDIRSDVYSFGATLYHMLTHLPPIEVHQRLLQPTSLISPRKLNPVLSEHTEQVVLKAMSIYPDERYQTAQEMRQAFKEPSNMAAAAAKGKKSSNSPVFVGILGLIVVLALLGVVAFMVLGSNTNNGDTSPTEPAVAVIEDAPTPQPSNTPTETPTQVVQTAQPTEDTAVAVDTPTSPPPTSTPTLTPTETTPSQPTRSQGIPPASLAGTIAYPVFNGTGYDLYLGQTDGSGSRLYLTNASQPAFSPDGSRIAYHSWNRETLGLLNQPVSGGTPIRFAAFAEDQLPTWHADGTKITLLSRRSGSRKSELITVGSSTRGEQGIVIGEGEYPTIGANGQLVFRGWGNNGTGLRLSSASMEDVQPVTDSNQDTAPALSPDGQKIAFMSRRVGNWEIYTANFDGTDVQRLTEDPAEDGLPTWSPDGEVLAFVSNRDGNWAVWAMTPTGEDVQKLFNMQGSPDGFVGTDEYATRGWAEERISWTR